MKTWTALALFALCIGTFAQEEEPLTPVEVYAQVNKDLNDYKSLEYLYELKEGAEPFAVKAWFDNGVFRRVKASQKGDGGVLTRDFYYDRDGGLRFALASLAPKEGEPVAAVEERFDFVDEKLVRYKGADGSLIPKDDKSFGEMEQALVTMSNDAIERIEGSTAFAGMIGGIDNPDIAKAPLGTVFGAGYADGVFAGVEKGDFVHLDLEQVDGAVETFFVLRADSSVEPFVNDPSKSQGVKIRVHWTEKMQDLSEAGGATRLKICDRIEVLK